MWAYERAAVDVSPNQACEPRRHEYVHFVHPGNGRSSAAVLVGPLRALS